MLSTYRVTCTRFPSLFWFCLADSPESAKQKATERGRHLGFDLTIQDWSSVELSESIGAFPLLTLDEKLTVLLIGVWELSMQVKRLQKSVLHTVLPERFRQ